MIKPIKLKEWKQGTGSRASGIEFRNLLIKIIENEEVPPTTDYSPAGDLGARQVSRTSPADWPESSSWPIQIDFFGISVISSGFADEVFGRLFVQYGPMEFGKKINLLSVNPTINSLIDKAITERIKVVYKC